MSHKLQRHEPDEPLPDGPTVTDLCRDMVTNVAKVTGFDPTDIHSCCATAIAEIRRYAAEHDVKWGDLLKSVSALIDEKRKEKKASADTKPILG